MPSVDPFFGPQHLPEEDEEFVAWVDVMGTSSMTEWSLEVASTNIGKLQTAVVESEYTDEFTLYPMMDGIYITSPEEDSLARFLRNSFRRFSTIAIDRHAGDAEAPIKFAPILRGGVAKGPVLHGYDLSGTRLADHPIRESIILGTPVAQAHGCEEEAPPFGLRLHSSVTENSEAENAEWWPDDEWGRDLRNALEAYFDYYEEREEPRYPDEAIEKHRRQSLEYLP